MPLYVLYKLYEQHSVPICHCFRVLIMGYSKGNAPLLVRRYSLET